MNYAKQIDSIYRVSKDTRRTTQPFSDKLTPAGRLFRKQWGRGSEQIAHKWNRKHPYLTAIPAILYFLIAPNGK